MPMQLAMFGHTTPLFRYNPLRTVPQEYLHVEDMSALGAWRFPGKEGIN